MSRDEMIAQIRDSFGDRLRDLQQPLANRINVVIEPDSVVDSADILHNKLLARLQTASAVDAPRKIEILYHWAFDSLGMIATVRTRIDRDSAEIDSITSVCPSAHWIEREMWELLGIKFTGHPDMRHLLLADDWPEGNYPMRRNYEATQ